MSWTIALWALAAAIGVPLVLSGYLFGVERCLAAVGPRGQRLLRPWMWLAPALLLLGAFLVVPAVDTGVLSFMSADSSRAVGFTNYRAIFTDGNILLALRNNLLWLVVFTSGTVLFGLAIAILADRVSYERTIKAAIFLPMAISFVAAGVIWKFMYLYQPVGAVQVGTINALLSTASSHFEPQAWLFDKRENNWALIAVGIWMWTGFAVVILSAGLKGIPESLIEAARMDGASEPQVFFKVILPLMKPTLTVVTTTLVIIVLKVFDVVYVMTNGNLDTDVVANRMYKEMFNYQDFGRASALAMVLLAAVFPVMVLNVRRFGRRGDVA